VWWTLTPIAGELPGWLGGTWACESILYEVPTWATAWRFTGAANVQLARVADMGITAIELMPLNEGPGQRNWRLRRRYLPFARSRPYGTPEQLRQLIDHAQFTWVRSFVDVVYNHFGPEGNYLGQYASVVFRRDIHTAMGPAIDVSRQPVSRIFFAENALMWLQDYVVGWS